MVAVVAAVALVGSLYVAHRGDAQLGGPELGISVSISDSQSFAPSSAVATAHNVDTYALSLGANSISLNFPLYVTSQTSNDPHSGIGTPSVSALQAIITQMERDGLSVQLRPLVSDYAFNLAGQGVWRGNLAPSDPTAWFNAYWNWFEPYAAMAGRSGVASLSIGTELESLVLNYPSRWVELLHRTEALYHGTIVYSMGHLTYNTFPGVAVGWDAYNRVPLATIDPTQAISVLTPIVQSFYTRPGFPSALGQVRLEEVGIPAIIGAWQAPSIYQNPLNLPVARWVQSAWFTAQCNAFWHFHMKGIYFWAIGFNGFTPTHDDTLSPYQWANTSAATSIQQCFARTS
jgi:hypothetical protein